MLYGSKNNLILPPYAKVRHFEGTGNFAIRKYYQWPFAFFYRKKLEMIVELLQPGRMYYNIMDFGAGPGIFSDELKRHCLYVTSYERKQPFILEWKFDVVVCASVLEFMTEREIDQYLSLFDKVLKTSGMLVVASPTQSFWARLYFRLIGDKQKRMPPDRILDCIKKRFRIDVVRTWLGLYFAVRAHRWTTSP